MCCIQHDNEGASCSAFLKVPPTNKPGIYQPLYTYVYTTTLSSATDITALKSVIMLPCATQNGVTYKTSDVLMLDCYDKQFVQICDVIVLRDELWCVGYKLITLYFRPDSCILDIYLQYLYQLHHWSKLQKRFEKYCATVPFH